MEHPDTAVTTAAPSSAAHISARLDRLPVMKPHFIWISILTANLALEYYDNALFAYVVPAIAAGKGLSLGQIGLVSTSSSSG